MRDRHIGFLLPLLLAAIALGLMAWPPTPVPVKAHLLVPICEARVNLQTHGLAGVAVAPVEDLLDQVLAAGKLVVAADANYAPWSFLNDQGELVGFDVDVAKEVASRLGVDAEFVTPNWSTVIAGSWSAQWDVSIGSMTPNDERAEVLWFTDPYYYNSAVFVVNKYNTTLTAVEQLTGKKVGASVGTPCEYYLVGDLEMGDYGGAVCYPPPTGVSDVYYASPQDALNDLALGDGLRLDAVLTYQVVVHWAIEEGVPVKYLGTSAFSEPLVFALDQARGPSSQMLAALNTIIAEMHSDCSLSWISLKWLGIDITKSCPTAPPGLPGCNRVCLPLVLRQGD